MKVSGVGGGGAKERANISRILQTAVRSGIEIYHFPQARQQLRNCHVPATEIRYCFRAFEILELIENEKCWALLGRGRTRQQDELIVRLKFYVGNEVEAPLIQVLEVLPAGN